MKTSTFILAGMVAACLAACTSDDNITDINNCYVDDGKSIKVEVTDEFAKAATRADYSGFPVTEFEEGDQIGVYAVNTSNAAEATNVAFTRQSDGSWTPASSVAYSPDYTYYAYFPYKSSAPSFVPGGSGADGKFANFLNSNTFWVADQSTKENFTTSNLMWAEGVITGERTVKFTMAHKRGLAIISPAVNQWYYSDNPETKYNATPTFSGNIPYEMDGTRYFLIKPNTVTNVGGMSLRAEAGKHIISEGIQMIGGSVSYQYSTDGGSTFSSTRPSWLPVPTIVSDEGYITMFSVSPDNRQTTDIQVGDPVTYLASDAFSEKTTVSNVDLSMVDNAGNPRAARTTANCYIVHNPGTYKIPLVYGNAIKNGETNTSAYHSDAAPEGTYFMANMVNHANIAITDPWLKNNSATPNGAELIWQDVKGMITAVGIDGDYLTFTVDPDHIAPGNALIAAKMGSTIVWSWHIWVTDETLSNTTRVLASQNKTDETYDVAPVNVGWVGDRIDTYYQGSSCVVKATCNGVTLQFTVQQPNSVVSTYGNGRNTYYQWGRKDPEVPADLYTNKNCNTYNIAGTAVTTNAKNSLTYVAANRKNGVDETIKNPQKHYLDYSGYCVVKENKYNFWNMNATATSVFQNRRTVKTVYDPCPPGFCVPTGYCFTTFTESHYISWTSTSGYQGSRLVYNAYNIFFPATGSRNYSGGSLVDGGSVSVVWTATSAGASSAWLFRGDNSTRFTFTSTQPSYGFAVRPVVEE